MAQPHAGRSAPGAAAGRDSLPLGLSLHQVLTLASIVEAEAMDDVERPRIARVYLNRLADGHAAPGRSHRGLRDRARGRARAALAAAACSVDSPFNTYLYEGLPPGPICNPGRASIAGVIDPLPGVQEPVLRRRRATVAHIVLADTYDAASGQDPHGALARGPGSDSAPARPRPMRSTAPRRPWCR